MRDLEADNAQLRAEVSELKVKAGDLEDADAGRRRAEERVDALERRVCSFLYFQTASSTDPFSVG